MPAFVIFVEGADTEPDPLPIFFVDSEEHATRICEGISATEYREYKFSFHEVRKTDLSKFPFWAEMTIDARDGVYGNIVAGIYAIIDRAHAIISGRRSRKKIASGADTETGNGRSTTAKQDDETADGMSVADVANMLEPPDRDNQAADPTRPADKQYFVSDVAKLTGYKNDSINGYAKRAGVRTAERGDKSFQWTCDEVVRILRETLTHNIAKDKRNNVEDALEKLTRNPNNIPT